jgi:glutamine synthetase
LPDIGSQTSPLDGFLARYPDTRAVDAFTFDLCGRPSGKRYAIDDAPKLFSDSGMAMCAAITLLDASGNTSDPLGYGVSDGDPDALCRPIAGTLAPVPWASAPTAQVMLEMLDPHTRAPIPFEPRRVLTRVLERFRELNITPVVAIELEFFLIDKDLTPEGGPLPARSPRTGRPVNANNVYGMDALEDFAPVLSAITEACAAQGIPASVLSGEFAPGQFELNLRHVADPLAAADHACLLRRAVLGTARAQGMDATFLSKPFPDSSGSGLHVHLSFQDASGVNILDDALDPEEKTLRHVMAGLAAAMPESMAFLAPNLNAFRRFKPDLFVPVTKDWGYDNRSLAFRVPSGRGQAKRIEHRVAGADANPYLALACVLAGAHHGLSRRLEPETGPGDGNVGETVDPTLPLTPWRALDALTDAPILSEYLSADYVAMYKTVKENEFLDLLDTPLPREFDWYL